MFHLAFMPWAGLRSEVAIGPVVFWPFPAGAKARVPDTKFRSELDSRLRLHVDEHQQPVETAVICSHGAADFRKLLPAEQDDMRGAVDALIFSVLYRGTKAAVCANNHTLGPPSADRFQLIRWEFEPGDNNLTVRAGSVTSAGWKVGEIKFHRPLWVGDSPESPDPKLLDGFSRALQAGFPADVRRRLFRALEWFRMAHTDVDEVSPLSQIVMMATAFEVLLRFRDHRKTEYFSKHIKDILTTTEFLQMSRKDHKGRDRTRSLAEWWAVDFYSLRSAIVHGEKIVPSTLRYRDWVTHLIVADLVFGEYILRTLYEHKCIGDDARSLSAQWDGAHHASEPTGSVEPQIVRTFLGFDNVHRALGWIPDVRKRPAGGWDGA